MKVDRKPFLDLFKSKKPTLVFVGCSHLRGPDKDTEDAFKEAEYLLDTFELNKRKNFKTL